MQKLAEFFIIAIVFYPFHSYAKQAIEQIGDVTQILVPAYAFGMTLYEKDLEGVKQFAYGFSATHLTVEGLKAVVDERRPNHAGKHSFPSGHAAAAFQGATFIHARYGLQRAIVPYLLAGYTAYSRVQAKKHYVHDVLASAAISGAFSWLFTSRYEESEDAKGTEGTEVTKALLKGLQLTGDTKSLAVGFGTRF
jgi:membrane-associated phospholipid phosphatase